MNHRRTICAAGACLWLTAATSFAGTLTWQGTTNTDWFTAGNWDLNAVPAAGDSATIAAAANQPGIGAAANIAALALNTGTSLQISNGGSLKISGGALNNLGSFNTLNGGALTAVAGTDFINRGSMISTGNVNLGFSTATNFGIMQADSGGNGGDDRWFLPE